MRILITGALGQDGRILSEMHIANGDHVVGVIRPELRNCQKNGKSYFGVNLAKNDLCKDFLDHFKPDVIYHFAAVHGSSTNMQSVLTRNKSSLIEIQCDTTNNFIEYMENHKDIQLIVALSSKMYSTNNGIRAISESSKTNPSDDYGIAKSKALEAIRNARKQFNLRASGLILFNHTSKLSKKEFLFPQIAESLRTKSVDQVISELHNPNALIDITDAYEVCDGIFQICKSGYSEEFVIGSGNLIELSELVRQSAEFDQSGESKLKTLSLEGNALISNPQKMKAYFGWQAKKTPLQILSEMMQQ